MAPQTDTPSTDVPPSIYEETDMLQFRDPNQPELHLKFWTREPLESKANANILFINHGIGEHCGRYRDFAQRVLKGTPRLDAVVSYDMRGHGESGGTRGWAQGIDMLITDVTDLVLPRVALRYGADAVIVLAGHSLGGAVVAGVSLLPDCLAGEAFGRIAGVFLSAPALEPVADGLKNRILVTLKPVLLRLPGIRSVTTANPIDDPLKLCSNPAVGEEYENDPLVHDKISLGLGADLLKYVDVVCEKVREDDDILFNSGVPTMIAHSPGDRITLFEGSKRLVDEINAKGKSSATLVSIKGAEHEMHMEYEDSGARQFYDCLAEFVGSVLPA